MVWGSYKKEDKHINDMDGFQTQNSYVLTAVLLQCSRHVMPPLHHVPGALLL